MQPDPSTATLRITMKGLDMRRQIYDVNVAIGGHNYNPFSSRMLGRQRDKITSKLGRQLSPDEVLKHLGRDQESFRMGGRNWAI